VSAGLTPEPQRSITVRAPAKVNLHLGVGARRADGFHPLDTVFQAVGLYDDVRATDGRGSLVIEPASYLVDVVLPDPDDNIIAHAARALAATAPDALGLADVDLLVQKRIPVAGGMAGGSADAAATLVALDRLWGLDTDDPELLLLAARLGSDVPFSLVGGTAHGTGRGDLLRPVPDLSTWWWVVVPSAEGLSTPAVYQRFDEMFPDAPETPAGSAGVLMALATGVPERLAAALHNDLEAAALDLRPDLGDLITRGEVEGALRGLVSGSGPTVLFLCDAADGARAVADALQAEDRGVVLVANGPVAGAHVLGPDVSSGA
jgi:4-diphosphocytidyl-2-C-methyl-D-erythritol kinase